MSVEISNSTDTWKSPRRKEAEARQTRHAVFEMVCTQAELGELDSTEAKELFIVAANDDQFAEGILKNLVQDMQTTKELVSH